MFIDRDIETISIVVDEGFDPKEANATRKMIIDRGYNYGQLIGINALHKDVYTAIVRSKKIFFVPKKDSRDITITSLNTLALAQSLGREVYSKGSNSHLRYKWDCKERAIGDDFADAYKPCDVVRVRK